jgi:hypothetical protein
MTTFENGDIIGNNGKSIIFRNKQYKCPKCSLIYEWFPYHSFSGLKICPRCFDDFIRENVPDGVEQNVKV